jgi:hypothetical protein
MMHSDIVSNDVHPRERSETSAACLGMPPTVAPQTHKMLRDTKSLTTALRRPQSIESHVIHSSPWGCPTAVIGFRAESLMIYGYDFDPYPYHPTYKYIYIIIYIIYTQCIFAASLIHLSAGVSLQVSDRVAGGLTSKRSIEICGRPTTTI